VSEAEPQTGISEEALSVTVAATFSATLVDEWARAGVVHAVIAPGSRSTPIALALAEDERMRVTVCHDERSAGFVGIGIGMASGRPAVVVTTSGTAAAELHPAIVEADLAGIPLIVATADRPAELRDVGAPQAIDQTHLFGRSVRWFVDPGVPDEGATHSWRSLAARAVIEADAPHSGPVHLNLPFRDPLIGRAGALPPARPAHRPWHERVAGERRLDHDQIALLGRLCSRQEGVIVAGGGIAHPEAVLVLAHTLGWPVLADPRSGCRVPDGAVVCHFDAIVRSAADALAPRVALRLGTPPASKVLGELLARPEVAEIVVAGDDAWFDPHRGSALLVDAEPSVVCRELAAVVEGQGPPTPWLPRWRAADDDAARIIAEVISRHDEPTEPGIARAVVDALPDGSNLLVGSSMPIRDVEWYASAREGLRVLANRGANGIDGIVSTAVGLSLTSPGPMAALLGDLAFLHDTGGLALLARQRCDLALVVVDNDGGGIFSFLPQASALERARFEELFGTPHGLDLAAIVSAHGIPVEVARRGRDVGLAIENAVEVDGPRVVVVETDRSRNVEVHDAIHSAVADALGATTRP
jgi:2-succinyl-5-enolpyruvyl-6-hydroxy-3-cyclohexene-1-carboxylate synthase